jgi:thiamine transport system substrate-binding protein
MKRFSLFATITAAALVLSACGSDASQESTETAGPVTVKLLTNDSFALSEELLGEFTQETGITIELVSGGSRGTMVAGAILAAGAPTADVMFGVDNTLVSRASDAGVFEPYTSTQAASLRPELADQTFDGLVTPIEFGDVCINIDDTWFAAEGITPPRTLEDLADPTYANLLSVQDPGTSSPGLAFLLTTVSRYGEDWTDYWQRLKDNGVKIAGSWTDAYYGDFTFGGGGDRPIVVSYATSPPAEIVYAEGTPPERPSTSVMTDGCYRQIAYAGILAGSKNVEAAQQVIDWLLSPQVQADIPLNMFVFPARADTPLPEVFTQFAAQVDDAEQLPSDFVESNLADLLAEWGSVMGR